MPKQQVLGSKQQVPKQVPNQPVRLQEQQRRKRQEQQELVLVQEQRQEPESKQQEQERQLACCKRPRRQPTGKRSTMFFS